MDKKIVGLVGTISGLVSLNTAQAAPITLRVKRKFPAQSHMQNYSTPYPMPSPSCGSLTRPRPPTRVRAGIRT
jgi:hypothetical protein